jgi:hypothetical protein
MPRSGRNRKLLIIGALIGAFMLLNKKAKGMSLSKFSFGKFKKNVQLKLLQVQDYLIEAGLDNDHQLKLALAQILLETGQFTAKSTVAKLNNNYSGIKWLNAPRQKNASKGSPVPPGERSKTNPNWSLNWYAKFDTGKDWAADYLRILNIGKNKPILAATPNEFVDRLKANRYFGGDINSYKKNVNYFYNLIN